MNEQRHENVLLWRTRFVLACMLGLIAIAGLAFAACGDDDDDGDGDGETPEATDAMDATEAPNGEGQGTTVNVSLTEWQVVPDVESAAAGSVTFNASNVGGEVHELVIIKTDLSPDSLPTRDDGGVDEEGEGIEIIDEIEEFAAGSEESITVDLEAGTYALICNIVEEEEDGSFESHYQEGMQVGFEVTE